MIVLDRDGVINFDSPDFIKSPDEWRPIPGSIEAIGRLTRAGWPVCVATNQSGLGRGLFDEPTLTAIHDRMRRAVEAEGGDLAGIFYCPHLPDDGCDCRKPEPGLLRQIERRFGISLVDAPVIGDSFRDLAAARSVGAKAILVRTGNGAKTEEAWDTSIPLPAVFDDLDTAVDALLAGEALP